MGTPAVAAPAAGPSRSRYRKLLDLATGGMGRVELALAQGEGNFARLIALKRLHAPFEHDDQFRAMFFDEARLAGLVHHPNVGSVVDVGRDDIGFYLAMEYVDGPTLAALIIRLRELRQTVPFQVACRIIAQVAHGLAAAHGLTSLTGERLDLVHRDVSPQNILIGYDGVVKVVDFGVARAAGRMQTTVGTALKGKLGYMSPEQLSFQAADARSDLFGLGVVLYELLALTRLYRSDDTNDGPRRILTEQAPRLRDLRSGVPRELDELGSALLAKRPEDRPQTAHEVALTLEGIASALAIREGAVDIGGFVRSRFTREREERREAIKAALAGADGSLSESAALAIPASESATGPSVSLVRPSRPEPSRVRTIAMAGIVIGAVIIGATVAFFSTGEESSTTQSEVPSAGAPSRPELERSAAPTSAAPAPTGAARDPTEPAAPRSAPAASGAASVVAPAAPTADPTAAVPIGPAPTSSATVAAGEPAVPPTGPAVAPTPSTAVAPAPVAPPRATTTAAALPVAPAASSPARVATVPASTAAVPPRTPAAAATPPRTPASTPPRATTTAATPTRPATSATTTSATPTRPATSATSTPTRTGTSATPRTTSTPARATSTPARTTTPGTRRTRPRSGVRIWDWP